MGIIYFCHEKKYKIIIYFLKAKEFAEIKIIRYEESVYYANVDNFKYRIIKLVGIDPATEIIRINKEKANDEKKLQVSENVNTNFMSKILKKFKRKQIAVVEELHINNFPIVIEEKEISSKNYLKNFNIKHVIIDCSCVNFIDSQGVNGILQVSS